MAANSRFAVAVHILTALAHFNEKGEKGHDGLDEPACSRTLAESVNTNPVVVRRILADLSKRGLVLSQQGKGGGVRLGRPAARITLKDIYEAMGESPVFAFNPASPNPECPVSARMVEVLQPVFGLAQEGLKESLSAIRLSELVRQIG